MNQPKYITYRGAKYERISTLNEIKVDPIPPRCCAVIVGLSRGRTWFEEGEFYNIPAARIPDILRQQALNTGDDAEEMVDEFFSVKKLDEYTYCGAYGEETTYMVSTKNQGVGSNVYELLEQYSKEKSNELASEVADEVVRVIDDVAPNWDF